MHQLSTANFGLLIAYVLPGITAVWGASHLSPTLRTWLGSASNEVPTIAGFLYVTLAAVAAGLIVSTVRWMVVDTVHYLTGVSRPRLDFSRFGEKVMAYDKLGEVHYRYYQHYSGMLVSLVFSWLCRRLALGFSSTPFEWLDLAFFALAGIFFVGSRDTFRKYNQRLTMVLGEMSVAGGAPAADALANGVGKGYRQLDNGNPTDEAGRR